MDRKTIRRNEVYIATQSGRNFEVIRTDDRPILVRQLEQDLKKHQDNYEQDLQQIPTKNFDKSIKITPPSRAASNQLFGHASESFFNDSKPYTKNEIQTPDALYVALQNTVKHGVYLPDSIRRDRRQLYRFCSDFCYLWTLDELREYCSVAGLLACGTKTELLRRTYLALHHAEQEFSET